MSEAIIRDYLKTNLQLLEPGLQLIEDEYHLRNPNGADGFLDIFAIDASDSLVVIEIKKTDAAARQAITEISKYAALLKHHKCIKESEFRIIIVSAAWHELLVPFSEFSHATNYRLSAFEISLNANSIPVSAKEVHTLPAVETRDICRRHFIWEFNSIKKLHKTKLQVELFFKKIGIEDYLLGIAKLKKPDYGITHMLYFAQQRKPKDFYFDIIRKTRSVEEAQEKIEYIEDLVEESDKIDEAADGAWENHKILADGAQISSPEKFVGWYGNWESLALERHGVFTKDERLTDALLIEDLKGNTGASFSHFFTAFRLDNKAKLLEVKAQLENSLFNNDEWRHTIPDIIEYAERKKAYSIALHIFNTSDILETIWAASIEPEKHVPAFLLVVESKDDAEIFHGHIGWNGRVAALKNVLLWHFDGKEAVYFLERHFGENHPKNTEVMKSLGFAWQIDSICISKSGEEKFENIVVRGSKVYSRTTSYSRSVEEFLAAGSSLQQEIVEMFNHHQINGGIFQL